MAARRHRRQNARRGPYLPSRGTPRGASRRGTAAPQALGRLVCAAQAGRENVVAEASKSHVAPSMSDMIFTVATCSAALPPRAAGITEHYLRPLPGVGAGNFGERVNRMRGIGKVPHVNRSIGAGIRVKDIDSLRTAKTDLAGVGGVPQPPRPRWSRRAGRKLPCREHGVFRPFSGAGRREARRHRRSGPQLQPEVSVALQVAPSRTDMSASSPLVT